MKPTKKHYLAAIVSGYVLGCLIGVSTVGGSPPNFLFILLFTPAGLFLSFEPLIGGTITPSIFLCAILVIIVSAIIASNTRHKIALPIGIFLFTSLCCYLGSRTIALLASV